MFSRTTQPETLQLEVGGTGNSLQKITMFDLEIELRYLADGEN